MADLVIRTGWRPDQEDWDYLATPTVRAFSAPRDFVPPEKMSYRGILKVENQGNMSSCVGHGGSSGMELLQFLSNGGQTQMSRMMCYLIAQRASNIRGDNGAVISACVQALAATGLCLESEFPYPPRYNPNLPQSAIQAGSKHKILGHQPLNSYREVFDWISQAKGPVLFGMSWYQRVANGNGTITPDSLRGPSYGGHCNVFCGYNGKKDSNGNYYIDALNSHGTSSGQGGWFEWSPDAVDVLCQQERGQSSVIGMTDITGFDQERVDRVVDWTTVV